MAVQDLPGLHRRYVDLAGRFKAAWTYHQFLQGLQKLFHEVDLPRYPTDLAEIHGTLKRVSDGLTAADAGATMLHLDRVARQLDQTLAILAAADNRVTPPIMRQFFDRVKSYDEQILAQMVRFYLGLAAEDGLSGDRLDKVDFLVTKLSEETDRVSGSVLLRDRTRLRTQFEGFWGMFSGLAPDPVWIDERRAEIGAFRREIATINDLDALAESQIVSRYREVKKLLGRYLFQPDVLLAAVETNLLFKNRLRQNFKEEEQRILDESQQILKLDDTRPPTEIGPDLAEFRRTLEEVERKQKSSNLKVEDLALLRRQIQELRPRLQGAAPFPGGVGGGLGGHVSDASDPNLPEEEALRPYFRELVAALEETNNQATPKEAALSRVLFPYRLEAREVTAFRRLYVAPQGERDLERFLLEAAAIRQRVTADSTEISEILDETMVTRDAPIFDRARRTVKAAEICVNNFGVHLDAAVKQGNFTEAQEIQLLRMRLIRDYSGLWLLVNRPTG